MIDVNNIDKEAFCSAWDEILSIMQSIESDKEALKNAKNELGSIIGAEKSKETNELIKALLRKRKESEFYDTEAVSNAEDIWSTFIEGGYDEDDE